MECQTLISGDVATIILPKEFSFNTRNEFRLALKEKKSAYEVDFQRVEKMDSAAFGMLLLLKEGSNDKKVSVVFKNVRPEVLRMLQLIKFDQVFTIL
ncbi:MAG: STAS domain-containing protein [Magnetococcales bacterium]|nr:STAS domain-containing protein [Magnetococcales bacterium]MBF0585193.1 STAS domain-containing protein [Magnetococcales bacterium]